MKKAFQFIIITVLLVSMHLSASDVAWAEDQKVDFQFNKQLEAQIRQMINRPDGDIFKNDLTDIKSLKITGSDTFILQYFPDLTDLEIVTPANGYTGGFSTYLPFLTKLEKLHFVREYPASFGESFDFSALKNSMSLKELYIEDYGIMDISALPPLPSLENLTILSSKLSDITSVNRLTNLKTLDLRENRIKDLTPIKDLKNLNSLFLGGNPISDFAPVQAYYEKLESKDFVIERDMAGKVIGHEIYNEKVSFVNKELEKQISIMINKPNGNINKKDLEGITQLKVQLGNGMAEGSVVPLDDLKYFVNLKDLDIYANKFAVWEDIECISGLTHLNTLKIEEYSSSWDMSQSFDITILSQLENLKELSLIDLNIVNLSSISALQKLEKLTIDSVSSPELYDISSIGKLCHMKELMLVGLKIPNFSPLSYLTSLCKLSITDCDLKDLAPLKPLTNLEELMLVSNQFVDISPISKLTHLNKLDLSNNRIRSIAPLSKLNNLSSLYLSANYIKDFSPVKSLYNKLTDKDFQLNKVGMGGIIGNIYSTDIVVLIDGYVVPSYNVDGRTAILVSDLNYYGFDVTWDSKNKMYNIIENPKKTITPIQIKPAARYKIGTIIGKARLYDIATSLEKYTPSISISGKTAIIINCWGIPGTNYQGYWDNIARKLIINRN